jgi:hypothetical protein
MAKTYPIPPLLQLGGDSVRYESTPEAEFLDEIQTKVLLAIHSHLCSFALRFLFLQTHATVSTVITVSTVQLLYTVKEKGGKPDR